MRKAAPGSNLSSPSSVCIPHDELVFFAPVAYEAKLKLSQMQQCTSPRPIPRHCFFASHNSAAEMLQIAVKKFREHYEESVEEEKGPGAAQKAPGFDDRANGNRKRLRAALCEHYSDEDWNDAMDEMGMHQRHSTPSRDGELRSAKRSKRVSLERGCNRCETGSCRGRCAGFKPHVQRVMLEEGEIALCSLGKCNGCGDIMYGHISRITCTRCSFVAQQSTSRKKKKKKKPSVFDSPTSASCLSAQTPSPEIKKAYLHFENVPHFESPVSSTGPVQKESEANKVSDNEEIIHEVQATTPYEDDAESPELMRGQEDESEAGPSRGAMKRPHSESSSAEERFEIAVKLVNKLKVMIPPVTVLRNLQLCIKYP